MQRLVGWTRSWWPFVLLCLVTATRWTFENNQPQLASTAASAAVGCGAAAAMCFLSALRRRDTSALATDELAWALSGAMLLCGPLVTLVLSVHIAGAAILMALALTPVAAGIVTIALGSGENLAGRVWPGLAAIAGLLLILPQPSLTRPGAVTAVILAPLLAGIGAAWFAHRPARRSGSDMKRVAALSGAALLFAAGVLVSHAHGNTNAVSAVAAIFDGLLAWLGVLTLERLGATRWTAQFVIAPLLFLLEGLAIAPLHIPLQAVAGLGLMLLASIFLLMPPNDEAPEETPAEAPE